MQIAKMFASLGFKVDTTGLVNFKKGLVSARSELTNLNQGAKKSTSQMRNLRREVDKLSTSMGKIKNATGNNSVSQGYKNIAGSAHKLNNALGAIVSQRGAITKAIGKINSSVLAGAPHWERYRESVVRSRIALRNLNGDLNRLRANSRIDIRINQNGGGGGGGGGNRGVGHGGMAGGALGLGVKQFLGNMIPTMALGGIGAGAGFAATKVVATAREQTSMESMILMTSKSTEEFKHTVDYINAEAKRLGLNAADFGKSFAQISMSAERLSQGQKEEMFTGVSEFLMAMGTNADDQKGIFRAINQMFSNNRILQEEINQLSDRGIPATLIYDGAMKAYGLDTVAQVKKLQEAGKLDPAKVWTVLAKMLQAKAHDTGAYDNMQQSSMFKQNQFMYETRAAAKELMDSGLDKMLGDLFGLLTSIVNLFKDFATVIGEATSGIRWFYNHLKSGMDEGMKFQAMLYTTFLVFAKMSGALSRVIPRLTWTSNVMKNLGVLMRGLFGRALGMIILRFGAWGVAIYAVSKAVSFLSDQIKRSNNGEWTLFDSLISNIDIAGAKLRVLSLELLIFAHNNKLRALNPWDAMTNPSEIFDPNTNARIPRPNPKPNTGTPTDLYRRNSIPDALKKFSQNQKGNVGVPWRNPTASSRNTPVQFTSESNIYINDVYRNTLVSSAMDA